MTDDPSRYDQHDPAELPDKMVTAIALGVSAEDSGLVRTEEDREMWNRLARSISAMNREGIAVIYSFPDDDVE